MTHTYHTQLLDHQLRATSEKDAVFTTTEGIMLRKETDILETFNHRYDKAAEDLSSNTPMEPIGVGANMESRTIAGIELLWRENAWRNTGVGYTLKIGAECDKNDVTAWLEDFKVIKKRILSRTSNLYDTLDFILGEAANKINSNCVAFANWNVVGFPTTQNGSHIRGIKLAQASKLEPELMPVEFHKVILHEIGHTMKLHLKDARKELDNIFIISGPNNWNKAEKLLKEISPHYLGDQFPNMLAKLGEFNVRMHAEPDHPDIRKDAKKAQELSGELFAEVCRHYYLEAVIEGKIRTYKPTGFDALDELCNKLCTQATLTIGKSKEPMEPDDPIEFTPNY